MLFGFLAGLSILAGALAFGHVPLHLIFNVEAILIVVGGTITATFVSFNQQTLVHAYRAFKSCFKQNTLSPEYCLDMVIEIANFVRTEDLLALQPLIDSIDSPFLRKGLKLVVDNRSETFIQSSLTTEIETAYREQLDNARVFETAGGFAPTMGIIGAVIGLIYVAQSFENPAELVLSRDGSRNLAFGEGIHFCVGMPLARLETRVGIGELLSALPKFELNAAPVRYPSHVIRGYENIPIEIIR